MAALWKLPIVTRTTVTPVTEISRGLGADRFLETRRVSFAIPGEPVDGMDVRSVHAARQSAFEHARTGKGPYILEMHTYRYRGHSMSDPAKYRSKDEVTRVREKQDPIDLVRRRLLEKWKLSEDELKAMDSEARETVNVAADFATNDPEPDPSELYTESCSDVVGCLRLRTGSRASALQGTGR